MEEREDTIGHREANNEREKPTWVELKTKAGKERKRLPLACTTCRRKKIKCSGQMPACERCLKAGLVCVYHQKRDGDVQSKNGHGSSTCDAGRLWVQRFESQRTKTIRGYTRDVHSVIYKQEPDCAISRFKDGGAEGKDETGNDSSKMNPFRHGDWFSTFPSGVSKREWGDQIHITTTMSERAQSRSTDDFLAVRNHDSLPLERHGARSTFRMTPVHAPIHPHPSPQLQATTWFSSGNSSSHSSTTGTDSMSCGPAVTSVNDQILSGVHNDTCATASSQLSTLSNVDLWNHGQNTTSLTHGVMGLDAQRWQINESEDDCVEDSRARKALQQPNMPRQARSRVHKLQSGQSRVASEVLTLRADLAQQMEHNSKLVEKFERLRQQDRRRREALKKGRQAVLQLCQEHATSLMVASLDDEVEIPHLVVELRERLNRKHKTYHDNLQRVRKQNNDLHCALEHYHAKGLKACQHTFKQTYAVPSTTLQAVATDTSIDHQMPTCGHPITGVVSYTACGRLLCETCTDNLREGIAVEEWVMDCHWCRGSCAVHAIPHQLRPAWTAGSSPAQM